MSEVLIAFFLHLGVPACGYYFYDELCARMEDEEVEQPPTRWLLILFATYGGWLMIGLTVLLWKWSGAASFGMLYLLCIAPIVLLVAAILLYPQRRQSKYHRVAFVASLVYPILIGLLFGVAATLKITNIIG